MTDTQLSLASPGSENTLHWSEVAHPNDSRTHFLEGSMGISHPILIRWSEFEIKCLVDIMKKLEVPPTTQSKSDSRTERYSRLLARMESWKEDDSGYDARVWPLVKKGLKADPVKCREPGS